MLHQKNSKSKDLEFLIFLTVFRKTVANSYKKHMPTVLSTVVILFFLFDFFDMLFKYDINILRQGTVILFGFNFSFFQNVSVNGYAYLLF